jgi:hypothetical protein
MTRKPPNPKRTLTLKLRRTVKVQRRFDLLQIDEVTEEQTCKTCGYKTTYIHKTTPEMAKKLMAYRKRGGGVSGVCPNCSAIHAKERYPLPEDAK